MCPDSHLLNLRSELDRSELEMRLPNYGRKALSPGSSNEVSFYFCHQSRFLGSFFIWLFMISFSCVSLLINMPDTLCCFPQTFWKFNHIGWHSTAFLFILSQPSATREASATRSPHITTRGQQWRPAEPKINNKIKVNKNLKTAVPTSVGLLELNELIPARRNLEAYLVHNKQ